MAFVILKAPFVVNILHVNTEPPPRKFKRFRDWRWSDQWLIKAYVKKGLRQSVWKSANFHGFRQEKEQVILNLILESDVVTEE